MGRLFESCKVMLTDDERLRFSEDLARLICDLMDLRAEKASSASQFAAKIREAENAASKLSSTLSNGYEYRPVECTVMYMQPRRGRKTIVRMDTGEIQREEDMTDAELQMDLGLDGGKTQ